MLIGTGFLAALLIYNTLLGGGLGPKGMLAGSGASILAFWIAAELRSGTRESATSWWIVFVEQFCLGTGANLLLHAVLTYVLFVRRTPILVTLGGLLASALLTLYGRWNAGRENRRYLMLGFDSISHTVAAAIPHPIVGTVASDAAQLPSGMRWLGGFDQLDSILREYRPTDIVVEMKGWSSRILPATLLNCRLAGVDVIGAPSLYEQLFGRVCCQRLRPGDLLLSAALCGDARTMAVQSVYTNLFGLALLIALAPLILFIALVVWLFSGHGPVLESFECAGFQHIPFRLLRFRTTVQGGMGEKTRVGRWISLLHLTNLPQLLNVVRGDMAIVGPRPVRSEFAGYLTAAMPFYSHRFSVRPGIIGWAQVNFRGFRSVPDECAQIEYDLFYIKEGSLWMDLEIMQENLMPVPRRKPAVEAKESMAS